nr:hypothetical protein GCM10017745_48480 [Saccharothrix mutabilis subsp. capreolus]
MNANALEPPRYRAILAVDIERSTARRNTVKALLREVMYDVIEHALRTGEYRRTAAIR